jgi:hypothetical protein
VYSKNQTLRNEKKKSLDNALHKQTERLRKLETDIHAKLAVQYYLMDPESLEYKEEAK